MAGCSSSSDDGGSGNPNVEAALQAFAFKGIVANAAVNVYALSSNGVQGRLLASGNTDSQGFVNIASIAYVGWVMFTMTGGTTTDFLGNTTSIPTAFPLIGLALLSSGSNPLFVATAMTTLVWYAMQAELARGRIPLGSAIRNAELAVAAMFGMAAILNIAPALLAQNSAVAGDSATHGAAAYGFCELAINIGIAEAELMHLMGRDLLDNKADGLLFDNPIAALNAVTLSTSIWTVLFVTAISNFMNSSFNVSGLGLNDIPAIITLGAITGLLLTGPLLYLVFPTFFRRDQDVEYVVRGENIPDDVADTEVKVGDQVIDPADVTVEDDAVRFTLRSSVAANVANHSPVTVTNTDTGFEGSTRLLLEILDSQAQPTVDVSKIKPQCVPSSGGGQVSLTGTDLSKDTVVMIDGQTANILAAEPPTRIHVCIPALDPGTYNLTLQNGSSSVLTIPDAITVKDGDLNASETPTDNNDQWGVSVQLGFNPSEYVRLQFQDFEWANADQGTVNVETHEISKNNTTRAADSVNANTNRNRVGEEESVLSFNSGESYNFFQKNSVSSGIRTGVGPDGVTVGFDKATNFTLDDIVGDFNVSVQWWSFEEDWRRHMWGSLVIEDDGTASIALRCFTVGLSTGAITFDELTGAFEIVTESDGQVMFTPIGSIIGLPNMRIVFDGGGCIGIGAGSLGNSLIYAMALRDNGLGGNGDTYGAQQGGAISVGLQFSFATAPGAIAGVSGSSIGVSVDRTIFGCDDEWGLPLRLLERNSKSTLLTDPSFDWGVELEPTFVSSGELRGQDGRIIGAFFSDGEKTITMRHDLNGATMNWGMAVDLPQYQSVHSLRGEFNSAYTQTWTAGDGGSEESVSGRVGRFLFDTSDARGHQRHRLQAGRCPDRAAQERGVYATDLEPPDHQRHGARRRDPDRHGVRVPQPPHVPARPERLRGTHGALRIPFGLLVAGRQRDHHFRCGLGPRHCGGGHRVPRRRDARGRQLPLRCDRSRLRRPGGRRQDDAPRLGSVHGQRRDQHVLGQQLIAGREQHAVRAVVQLHRDALAQQRRVRGDRSFRRSDAVRVPVVRRQFVRRRSFRHGRFPVPVDRSARNDLGARGDERRHVGDRRFLQQLRSVPAGERQRPSDCSSTRSRVRARSIRRASRACATTRARA